jgi:hypothetical protein
MVVDYGHQRYNSAGTEMTSTVKSFLVASFIYLLLGLVGQAVTVLDAWFGFNPLAYTATTAILQILLVGWLTQAALALIYDRWLVPPEAVEMSATSEPGAASHRTVVAQGQLVFILFNLGLPLVIIGRPGLTIFGGPWLAGGAVLGALLQLLAVGIFLRQAWQVLRRT